MLILHEREFPERDSSDEYDEYDEPIQTGSRVSVKLFAALLAIVLPIGYTMAGNISLGGSQSVEFGQGIALYTACSGNSPITLQPNLSFVNGNPGSFRFTSFDVSNVPIGCNGVDLQISAYGETDSALSLFETTGKVVNVYNNSGSFEANSPSGYSVINTSTGAFRVTFTNPVAGASDIARFTLQSGVHVANAAAPSFLVSAGNTMTGQYADASAMDSSGNIYTLSWGSQMEINGVVTQIGASGFFVTKSNTSGDFLWTQGFAGSATLQGKSIDLDSSGNIFVGGFYSGSLSIGSSSLSSAGGNDAFVAKLDSSGNGLWARTISGSASEIARSVTTDSAGNVIVTGEFTSSQITAAGQTLTRVSSQDIFIAKYDSNGTNNWALRGTTPSGNSNFALSIDTDSSNNIFVSGAHSGNLTIGTVTKNVSNTNSDAFVAKIDSSGSTQWIVGSIGGSTESARAIHVSSAGEILALINHSGMTIAGSTLVNSGLADNAVVKFRQDGTGQWATNISSETQQDPVSITTDAAGNVFALLDARGTTSSGSVTLALTGGVDVFLFGFNSSGFPFLGKAIGGTSNDSSASVHAFNGFFYATGDFRGSLTFEGTTLTTSTLNPDLFIAAFRY